MSAVTDTTPGDVPLIAVIGMACRLPGARNVREFWRNLRDGVESIRILSDTEIEGPAIGPDPRQSPQYVKAAATLDGFDQFDADFFGYSPTEARLMDPQQRLLLECAWEALEDGGYAPGTLKRPVGVFAGSRSNTYLVNLILNRQTTRNVDAIEIGLGNDPGFLATRISYKLNLTGPSCAVHTACSTSLVAVHLACESLLVGECDMALAGGVAVNVPHRAGYIYRPDSMLSPDGHCRAFAADAGGTVFASGLGLVVLKRLEDAVADGDAIRAIIRGTAVNNDGGSKASYTAPGVDGQADLVLNALANAGVEPDSIGYIEAHGTGTALGDPIEIRALTKAFRTATARLQFCPIGSVKTNVGHLDAAAGIASLIKTVLALEHEMLPPSLHCETPSPHIDFGRTPFYVNTHLAPWPRDGVRRRAGVSSFGVGGTNAHVILEEAPSRQPSAATGPELLVISAKTSEALARQIALIADHLAERPDDLADVAYTLARGRAQFPHRWSGVCRDASDAVARLRQRAEVPDARSRSENRTRPVAFLFPGQGSQYAGMGAEIYETEPTFREAIDHCADRLGTVLGADLRALLFGRDVDREAAERRLGETQVTQPALLAFEWALARLWMHWGVTPHAMIGHSIGEYTAACISGVLTIDDALRLLTLRGRLMQQLPPAAMLAVSLAPTQVERFLGDVDLAAVNGPDSCVLSGRSDAIADIKEQLVDRGVSVRQLAVTRAFHSRMTDAILDEYADAVRNAARSTPQIPYVSNVTGTWITGAQVADPRYWSEHLRRTVLFEQGISELANDRPQVLLELGPGRTLAPLCRRVLRTGTDHVVLPALDEEVRGAKSQPSERAATLAALGRLWEAHADVNWDRVGDHLRRQRVSLPSSPFERKRFWVDADTDGHAGADVEPDHKNPDRSAWFYAPSWQTAPAARGDVTPLTVLVFADDGGVGDALAKRLENVARSVIVVREGAEFGEVAPGEYVLHATEPDHYETLVERCSAAGPITHVVHLWSLSSAEASLRGRVRAARERSFASLVFLSRACARRLPSAAISVLAVTHGLHDVTGDERLNPDQALVLGPCRVVPQEIPTLRFRNVDVVVPVDGQDRVAERLVDELLAATTEAVVAHRYGRRWAQRLERRPLGNADAPSLRAGGTYVVAGGLGGVGAIIAEHVARQTKGNITVIARTPMPSRDQWSAVLAGGDAELKARVERLARIERAGGVVATVCADVADPAQLRDAIAETRKRFGAIDGFFHAAGVPGGSLVRFTTLAQADVVLRPKVDATLALDEVFASEGIGLLVLFSSISSVLGEFGQVDYCAANSFLDAYARAHVDGPRRVLSIDWDTWAETGMSRAALDNRDLPAIARRRIESELRHGLSGDDGCAVMDAVLAGVRSGQILVSTRDVGRRLAEVKALATALVGPASSQSPARARASDSKGPSKGSAALERVMAIMSEVAGVAELQAEDNFFELGGHSLLATRLIARLSDEFGVDVPLRTFLESPTALDLARCVDELQAQPSDPLVEGELEVR